MSGGRWSASATLLGSSSNGTTSQKVLVAGGINGSASLTTAQLYNQTAGTWAAAGTLNAARHLHTATLLNDGRVLVCGGMNGSTVLTSAALYNPASGSGSWAATTGPIPPPGWRFGTATLIATANQQLNGKVLLAGGNNGTNTISAVFLFDPAQSAFSTLASMPSPREGHQAVVLSDGRILFAGGKNGSTYLASSVIFDPSWGPGNWTAAGNMTSSRWGHAMNLLPSGVLHLGLVLVTGGSNGTSTLSSTEYWNGTNWATDGVMVAPVQQHVSVALGNSILIAGGAINNGSTTVSAAEVYDPSIALGCTSGSQCASGFCVSGVCCDSSCNGGCGSCNLTGHLGICTPLTSGTVCRALAGICDAAETCDGSSLACPSDVFQPPTTVCRASAGVCDVAETCTGASVTCPQDRFASAATVCRPAAGACDRAENCTGTGPSCPADLKAADGTACNDGNACTKNDVCTGGTCGGMAYGCDDGLACTNDVCNGDGTCTHTTAAGNCLIGGACYAAGAGSPINQCQQCTPAISQTAWSPRPAGTACSDGNACTKNDVCNGASACIGTAYTCNDGLACTADSCNGDGTCSFTLLPGNCAIAGVCYADGTPSPTNQCQQCTSSASGTGWSPKANGTACNDQNACTQTDTCVAGSCAGNNPVQCTASDQCHAVGTCNVGTGACSNPAKPDGTTCDDGNAQTQADVCTMGMCQGAVPCASVGSIFAGGGHSCALRTDKSLWCWGLNSAGQVGNGTTDNSLVPVRVGATTWTWTSATAGGSHSCAIRSDKTLWCWGLNQSGQLGNNTTVNASTPTQAGGQNWTTAAAGLQFTCGIQSGGTLLCWGANTYGNLGSGNQTDSATPVPVVGTNWVSVATGTWHACGIQGDHSLWCWGQNSDGRLGNGSSQNSPVPVQVGGAEWSTVTAGGTHTCGIKLDGSLWCWGANLAGQLGTGSSASSATPVKVGSATWTGVAAGAEHTCGIQTDGTLWCWGLNDSGEVGDGLSGNQLAPVRIPGQAWTGIAAGAHHTCGRRQDGSLWCWGENSEGEMGDGTTDVRETPEQVVGNLCSQVPICGNHQVEQGEQCDDGNNVSGDGCTWDCQVEKCFGVVCTPPDQCNDVVACDPQTGTCPNAAKPDGTACDDGNACTQTDTCQAGACKGDNPIICPTPAPCHDQGACDPSTGACSYAVQADGSSCEDGDACTTNDTCMAGTCKSGPGPTCDDGNPDTVDYCDSSYGCEHLSIAKDVPPGSSSVSPIIDCVAYDDSLPGYYYVIFGYRNDTESNVHIPTGGNNSVTYQKANGLPPQTQPTWFRAGEHHAATVTTASFDATGPITWLLNGSTAVATADSPRCTIDRSGATPVATDDAGHVFDLADQPDQQPTYTSYANLAGQILPTETVATGKTAGRIDGTFAVTDDGAATYRIPLWVPPGRAGVQPNLALAYSSSAGNGVMGMGWHVDGLSTITRCVQDWARDQKRRGIHFDQDDRLCFDGQRLALLPGSSAGWNRKYSEYRTEIDKYMKIVQIGEEQAEDGSIQPTGFLVYMPNGTIRSYGTDDGSPPANFHGNSSAKMAGKRIHLDASDQNQDPAQVTWTSATLGWALASSSDRFGNQVSYYYHVNENTYVANLSMTVLDFRPDYILYTSSKNRTADRKVQFNYDEQFARSDVREAFVGGMPLRTAHALTSITMSGPNPVTTTALRTYKLTYEDYPQRLLLKTVAECDPDSVCKPATSFDWTPSVSTFVKKDTGLKDHIDFGESATTHPNASIIVTGDFNGDGKDDIAYWRQINNVAWGQFHVRMAKTNDSTGSFDGFGDEQLQLTPANDQWIHDYNKPLPFGVYNQTRAVDLNMDGKAELIVGQESGVKMDAGDFSNGDPSAFSNCPNAITSYFTPNYCPYLLKGDGSAFEPDSKSAGADCNPGWCQIDDCSGFFVITCNYMVQNAPAGFYTNYRVDMDYDPYSPSNYQPSTPPMVGDFDGDGLPDLIRPYNFAAYPEYQGPVWAYRPNGGNGFAWDYVPIIESLTCEPSQMPNPPNCVEKYSIHPGGWNTYVVDIDGDRQMELIFWDPNVPNNPTRLRAFKGASSGALKTTLLASEKQGTSIRYQFADVNGDGLQDAIEIPNNGGSIRLAYNTGAGFLPPVSIALSDYAAFGQAAFQPEYSELPARDTGARVVDFDMDGRADVVQLGTSCRKGAETNVRQGALVMEAAIGSSHGYGSAPLQTTSYLYQDDGSAIPLGDGFSDEYVLQGLAVETQNTVCQGGFPNSQVLDVNGDGLADILQVESGSLYVYVRQGQRPGLLQGVTDGFGNQTTVTYLPTTNTTVHTPASGSDCTYPQYCGAKGAWVVSSHVEAAASSTTRLEHSHQYLGARTDVTGIGWLGMDTHIVTEKSTGVKFTVNYDHKTKVGNIYVTRDPVSREEAYPIDNGQVATLYKESQHQCDYRESTETRIVAKSCLDEEDRYEQKLPDSSGTTPARQLITRRVVSTTLNADYGYVIAKATEIGTSSNHTENERIGWSGDLFEEDDRNGSWLVGMVAHESTYHQMPPDSDRKLGVQQTTRETYYTHDLDTGAITAVQVEPSLMGSQPNLYLTRSFDRNEDGLITKTTTTGWDATGSPKKVITSTSYDPVSGTFPTMVTNALQQSTLSIVHPGLGVGLEKVDANGLRTTRQFDKFGRLRGESRPDGATTIKSYGQDLANNWPLTVATSEQGNEVLEGFNQQGLRSDVIAVDFGGEEYVAQHSDYDSHGRVAMSARPYAFAAGAGHAQYQRVFYYDSLGRVIADMGPIGTTNFTYVGNSMTRRVIGGTLPGTNQTGDSVDVTLTDPAGRVSERIETVGVIPTRPGDGVGTPRDITTRYYYGPFNVLEDIWPDVVASHVHIEYDVLGRRTLLSDPDTGVWRDTYDSFGELTERKHMVGTAADSAADQDVKYQYDLLGRKIAETNYDGASTFTWDVAADGMGKLAATESPDGVTLAYEYNAQGQRSAEVLGVGGGWSALGFGYDGMGRMAEIDYPAVGGSRYKVYYDYNNVIGNGALVGVRDTPPGGTYLWQVTGRNLDGQVRTETFGDLSSGVRNWELQRGLLKSIEVDVAGSADTTSYSYDARGYLVARSNYDGTTESFIHDELGRLRHWSNSDNSWYTHYDYDILGNMTGRIRAQADGTTDTTSFDVGTTVGDGPHVLSDMTVTRSAADGATTAVTTKFANDDFGRRKGVDATGEKVSFTDFDLPRSITRPNGTWGFKYDAFHQRVVKDGPSGSILYHGSLYERRSATSGGVTQVTHVMYVPGDRGEVVAQVTVAEADLGRKTEYLHTDHLGSTTTVTAVGQAPTRVRFEPFGSRLDPASPPAGISANPVPDVSIGFSGQEQEDDLGYINMIGRIYDPGTARFLTADPFVTRPLSSQGYNRYSYGNNSPFRFVDPTGFQGEDEDIPPLVITETVIVDPPAPSADPPPTLPPEIAEPEPESQPTEVDAPSQPSRVDDDQSGSGPPPASLPGANPMPPPPGVWTNGLGQKCIGESCSGNGQMYSVGPGVWGGAVGGTRMAQGVNPDLRFATWATVFGDLVLGMVGGPEGGAFEGIFKRVVEGISEWLTTRGARLGAEIASSFGARTLGAAEVRILQTGGHKIVRSTANALNEATGMNLTRREWGRALEALKAEHGLPPAHHGSITSVGSYLDEAGNIIDSLLGYVP